MRTTVDIDDPILNEVKKLQKSRGLSLGRVVSDLLARSLHEERRAVPPPPRPWICRDMGARFDLEDKDALYATLDGEHQTGQKDRSS